MTTKLSGARKSFLVTLRGSTQHLRRAVRFMRTERHCISKAFIIEVHVTFLNLANKCLKLVGYPLHTWGCSLRLLLQCNGGLPCPVDGHLSTGPSHVLNLPTYFLLFRSMRLRVELERHSTKARFSHEPHSNPRRCSGDRFVVEVGDTSNTTKTQIMCALVEDAECTSHLLVQLARLMSCGPLQCCQRVVR